MDITYLSKFENEYSDFDEKIMSLESNEELKNIEGSIIDQTNKGYNQCKIKHQQLYDKCIAAHSKHCTHEMCAMLQHKYSTQKKKRWIILLRQWHPKQQYFLGHLH